MYTYERPREGFGQLIPSPPAGSDYIRWVQRSLNLRLKLCLLVDGLDSQTYRQAVRRFQSLPSVGLTPNGNVDAQTQNALIRANERNFIYILWVQVALNKIMPLANVPEDGTLEQKTQNAIRELQLNFALRVDGVVGPKTEAVLAYLSRIEPPSGECI